MLKTTAGQYLINEVLPPEMRDYSRVLDKKNLTKLLADIAKKYPDKYQEIVYDLSRIGVYAAQREGGYSFRLDDLRQAPTWLKLKKELFQKAREIRLDPRLSELEKRDKLADLTAEYNKKIVDGVLQDSIAENNNLALQIVSGSRGNPSNLRSIRAADLLYLDGNEDPVPIPVFRSYAQGLSPAEYFAGSFGARKGVIDTKLAVRDAGFSSKQFNQVAHRLVVVGVDSDKPDEFVRGLPVDIDDPDNEGALLAAPVAGYERNTILTPKVIQDIKSKGVQKIIVRSPLTSSHASGGVYSRDVGIREKGQLPPVGDFVGIAAAQALSEPLTQATLSSKHSGGVAAGTKIGGFALINSLFQAPQIFKGGAVHAQVDGQVKSIKPAPQGGYYVTIGTQQHYVPPHKELTVKEGDVVEAGDTITEGIPHPREVATHKGLGEARRYLTDALRKAYTESGITAHRRNVELVVRGLLDHVELDEELEDYVPGDVVSYNFVESKWKPRADAAVVPVNKALNKFLERPVLHYSIGTRITPSVEKTLREYGIDKIVVHDKPPPFRPVVIRGLETVSYDPDWMTKFLGSYLKRGLLKSVHRAAFSDEHGTSYVPALARSVRFGQEGFTAGYKVEGPVPKPPQHTPEIMAEPLHPETISEVNASRPNPYSDLPKAPERSDPWLRTNKTDVPAASQQAQPSSLLKSLNEEYQSTERQKFSWFMKTSRQRRKGVFASLEIVHKAGDKVYPPDPDTENLFDDSFEDDEFDYDRSREKYLRDLTYPTDFGVLKDYRNELGDPIGVFVGTAKKDGRSGAIRIRRYDRFRKETLLYKDLSFDELRDLLIALLPVLVDHAPVQSEDQLENILEYIKPKIGCAN